MIYSATVGAKHGARVVTTTDPALAAWEYTVCPFWYYFFPHSYTFYRVIDLTSLRCVQGTLLSWKKRERETKRSIQSLFGASDPKSLKLTNTSCSKLVSVLLPFLFFIKGTSFCCVCVHACVCMYVCFPWVMLVLPRLNFLLQSNFYI